MEKDVIGVAITSREVNSLKNLEIFVRDYPVTNTVPTIRQKAVPNIGNYMTEKATVKLGGVECGLLMASKLGRERSNGVDNENN